MLIRSSHRTVTLAAALVLIAAMVLVTASPALAAGQTTSELAVVRAAGATLYNASGTVVRELPANTRLTANGRNDDEAWLQVTTPEGETGWVSADQVLAFGLTNLPVIAGFEKPVSPVEPVAAATGEANPASGQTATVDTTGQRLNVRSGPGATYRVIASLAQDQSVPARARSQDGAWIQVAPPALAGGFGWVSAGLVDVSGEAGDLPVSDEISDAPALPAAPSAGQRATPAAGGLQGTIAFQQSSGGAIYTYDPASGATRQITTGADPALSPDGKQIAFWRDADGQHHLYLINSDGSGERRILTRGEMIRSPSWSPDGQRIVFSRVAGEKRCRDTGYGICLPDVPPYSFVLPLVVSDAWGLSSVDLQGGDFHDLPAQQNAIAPDWGQAGVVYESPTGIELTGDGTDAENRAIVADFRYHDPALQPSGNRIVFQSLEKDHWEIFTATSDGANVTALTRPATTLITPFPQNVAPVWSPDGRQILFLSNRDGDWALWTMNADGSGQRKLPIDVPISYDYQIEQVASWQ